MAEFTWGDEVRVKADASPAHRPGASAAVVGILEIENERQAQQFGAPIGGTVYIIEFADGSSVELSETWLEAIQP